VSAGEVLLILEREVTSDENVEAGSLGGAQQCAVL
jgi:hypothetical protein